MKIGIDISQLAFPNTGVANYLYELVNHLLRSDTENEYVLFYSSLRQNFQFSVFNFESNKNVKIKTFKYPPVFLDLLWNKLHVMPIEQFIGDVDIFITSDWTEPPVRRAKKATIIYDMIIFKYPDETHNSVGFSLKNLRLSQNIVAAQKRKLKWVKKESDAVFAISEATKKDIEEILHIPGDKIHVMYPGI